MSTNGTSSLERIWAKGPKKWRSLNFAKARAEHIPRNETLYKTTINHAHDITPISGGCIGIKHTRSCVSILYTDVYERAGNWF